MHVFGRWEEAGVPGENPCIHRENMQTPSRDLNQEPSRCEAMVIATIPPCSPPRLFSLSKKCACSPMLLG